MTFRSDSSNEYQFFVSKVDPMPNRFTANTQQGQHRQNHQQGQHRQNHHVKYNDGYEGFVVAEAPRSRRPQVIQHPYPYEAAEDVDEVADEFIKLEHKKFLMSQSCSSIRYD